MKSIVWPPSNPIDNELSGMDPTPNEPNKNRTSDEGSLIYTTNDKIVDSLSQHSEFQQKSIQESSKLSHKNEQYSSNVSYASTTTSSSVATSSKTESILQSQKSQMVQETSDSAMLSFSAVSSSESQDFVVCDTQTKPLKEVVNQQSKVDRKDEFNSKSYSGEINTSVGNTDQPKINLKQQERSSSVFDQSSYDSQKCKSDEKNISIATCTNNGSESKNKLECEKEYTSKSSILTSDSINNENNGKTNHLSKQSISSLSHTKLDCKEDFVDALTIASDRPYSPLQSFIQSSEGYLTTQSTIEENKISNEVIDVSNASCHTEMARMPSQPSPIFSQQPKRGITPIPPIKTYNPTEKNEIPVPMPIETEPYIPPDFRIVIEPKVPREKNPSPMVDALTTAPNRPFTPNLIQTAERGSLRDALTIAPDRNYSNLNIRNQNSQINYTATSSVVEVQSTSSEIIRPIATQTSTQSTDHTHAEYSSLQNNSSFKTSFESSAFKPVSKQVLPPPQSEEFCKLTSFPPISNELKSSFEESIKTNQEIMVTESMQQSAVTTTSTSGQGFSSVKTAQSFFEQLDKKESMTSSCIRSKSGLQKADSIPPYQKNFDQLPSQRGITPEICSAPAVFQRPVTPTTEPPSKPREKSLEPNSKQSTEAIPISQMPQSNTIIHQNPKQYISQFQKDTPISMTFQPVADENFLRVSPSRSRTASPSLINKPAPIIPYYQMNLVTVEHFAPESHLYDPSSPEASRSPTPKLRSKSPAPGPPLNPLKAQAPRIRDSTNQGSTTHSLLSQATSNLRKEHELLQKDVHNTFEDFKSSYKNNCSYEESSNTKEQRFAKFGYNSENYRKENINVKENSTIQENYGRRQAQSQNVLEQGNTTVQTTRKTFEEFERTQSAKVIEIRKDGSSILNSHQSLIPNVMSSNISTKQIFPPPLMNIPASQKKTFCNPTNENVAKKVENYQTKPSISGANQGPVCDPAPLTGSSVGAATRGKTFGVSSAPKRGRGVLNKAALPGSRVPLCGSCNGNIRGPFITALGRIWCPEHFVCVNATCRRPLQDIGFVEENGQLYCEYCFEQYIAPACDKCHAKIKGDCLNAIGKHFHPECFNCVYCGKLFGNNPFFLEDGLPYCESDWNELFTTKCFACGFPVEAGDRWVEALNNNYHSQCFNCTVCKKNLEGQSFFAKGGRPFCKIHAR